MTQTRNTASKSSHARSQRMQRVNYYGIKADANGNEETVGGIRGEELATKAPFDFAD